MLLGAGAASGEEGDASSGARRSSVALSWAMTALASEWLTMYFISSAGLLAPRTASAPPAAMTP